MPETLENIGKLKDNQRFRYWIYKIALNQCRAEDRKRKQKPWHSIFHDKETLEVVSELHDPEQAYQQMEKEEIISNMLLSLPEDQRVLVIMKEFEGLKFREIADALGISESTAKSRLYYGLSRLKIMIEKSELNIR